MHSKELFLASLPTIIIDIVIFLCLVLASGNGIESVVYQSTTDPTYFFSTCVIKDQDYTKACLFTFLAFLYAICLACAGTTFVARNLKSANSEADNLFLVVSTFYLSNLAGNRHCNYPQYCRSTVHDNRRQSGQSSGKLPALFAFNNLCRTSHCFSCVFSKNLSHSLQN